MTTGFPAESNWYRHAWMVVQSKTLFTSMNADAERPKSVNALVIRRSTRR
jgi:hypothetical protein